MNNILESRKSVNMIKPVHY